MIRLEHVCKRYRTTRGPGPWVLQDISITIPARCSVGLVGANGAGKSTLLRLIAGADKPTRGSVNRMCRVSWPLGLMGGLQSQLTGRQNAKFVCRLLGRDGDLPSLLAFVESFADIGAAFDQPVGTYSSGMGARLKFALSLAFSFDVYLVDELTAVGDAAFRKKSREAFREVVKTGSVIMVSHQEGALKEFCQAGIFIDHGRAHWFDQLDDALYAYRQSTQTT